MSYITASLVVDGAEADNVVFDEPPNPEEQLEGWMNQIEGEAREEGWSGELYVIHHDHDLEDEGQETECACVQYLQDHRPIEIPRAS